ncbi:MULTISPECIES: HD domain-containing protein [unclassified Carboxylicivirga]|uniref:HD domain-containing protein n=1 Tax=Carboxylicivirga TaxID=1628153 RepID=UPI003D34D76D
MNIDTDYKMDDLILIKYLNSIDSPFLPKIAEVYDEIKEILNTRVQRVFPNYTLHNTSHSFRVMEYMGKLIHDVSLLDELEVVLLVYAALLHDIGMAVGENDIDDIKNDNFKYCNVKFSAMKKIMDGNDDLALQEYVRRIHSSLSARYINENLKDNLTIPKLTTLDFTKELALICESHTKDYDWIKENLRINEVRGDYSFNSQFIACILRLADILDIDSNRTPYNLYKLIVPKGISDDEWKQHYVISNNEKILFNEKTQQKRIVFHGKATNASIHRKLLSYIGWVKDELINATALVNHLPTKYSLVYDTTPEINIQTEGYTFSDYKMNLEFRAISSLLMGEKIYGDKSLGLRELIQNSLDSCRIRQETEERNYEFGEDKYQPRIKVILSKSNNQVVIKDNGTGMSMDIVKKHFLNIGVSYYNSTEFLLNDFNYKPIGNFGIGFLSCFMLSDEVKVLTRHYKEKSKFLIELEKGNEWTSLTESLDVTFEGTEVILNYNDFISTFDNNTEKVKKFLNQYFLTDGVNFELVDKSAEEIFKIENQINLIPELAKGHYKIDLGNYLNEIEGYAIIKNKSSFITTFDDLDFIGNIYIYDDESGLKEVEELDSISIDDFVNNNEIKYLAIPIVESFIEDDFLSGMKFTEDDIGEVIDKLDRQLTWISIIVHKDSQSSLTDETIEPGNYIFDNLEFSDLVSLGHSDSCATKSYVKTISLFEGKKNDLYLPFNNKSDWMPYYWRHDSKRKELFMRSVLIKDFRFDIPISALIFDIETIVVNINSRLFIPDISRNNIDSTAMKMVNYIIGKSIHLGASDILELGSQEKLTLNNFIQNYYAETTEFEKV